MNYQNFIFKSYDFNQSTKELFLYYSIDGEIEFCEKFKFDFDFANYDETILDRAIQTLFFVAGVSYYKTYLPQKIVVNAGQIDSVLSTFYSKTYEKGLGEFFYLNKLDPTRKITFPSNTGEITKLDYAGNEGLLIGVGGGKDSLLSIEYLRSEPKASTWSVGHREQLQPLISRITLGRHYWVERTWDRSLVQHNANGAYNGHVPISAILASVGLVVAVLSGNKDIVVSNENSANEDTLVYDSVSINHQYSKTSEFEKDFQDYLTHLFGDSFRYYSYLRPLSELYIAELFADKIFDKYSDVFSSCNRAFTHLSDEIFWCGECAKCAFTFLVLTPFIEQEKLEKLWGKNLLLDPRLEGTYKNLLGISGEKPLDCVGEVKESRAAMRLAKEKYDSLSKYAFEIPDNYDYKDLANDLMPAKMRQSLIKNIDRK